MASILRELRFSVRALCRKPGFTAVVTLTLALGIGGTTTIFNVIHAVLLSPPPYPRSERIVAAFRQSKETRRGSFMPTDFKHWQDGNRTFDAIAGYSADTRNLVWKGHPLRVGVLSVTPGFFQVLGVSPLLGNAFGAQRLARGNKQAVLTARLWRHQFNSDPTIIGQVLSLDDEQFVISGVMPENFRLIEKADLLVPAELEPVLSPDGTLTITQLKVLGRLKDSVGISEALTESDTILKQAARHDRRFTGVQLVPLHQLMVENIQNSLLLLLGAVLLVLIIACANAANLVLARNAARVKEIAIRTALGASRMRIVWYFLCECLLLSIFGGAGGVVLAIWGARGAQWLLPKDLFLAEPMTLNGPLLLFTLLVALLTAAAVALAPVLRFTDRTDIADQLKENPRWTARGARPLTSRNGIVVAQVALTTVLVATAGLITANVVHLLRIDVGFNPGHVVTFSIAPPKAYSTAQTYALYQGSLLRIKEVPGVADVGIVAPLPLSGIVTQGTFEVQGGASSGAMLASQSIVTGDYFKVMGIGLVGGRYFSPQSAPDLGMEAIVDETFARRVLRGTDPLRSQIRVGLGQPVWRSVVGVVREIPQGGLDHRT